MTIFLAALSGPIVWALHFFAVYGTQTVFAARGDSVATLRIAVAALTLAAIAIIVVGTRAASRRETGNADLDAFMPYLGKGVSMLSGLAILWTFLSAIFVD